MIGITKPKTGDDLAYMAIRAAVYMAGGRSMKLSTGTSWRDANIDGLIIGGGADVFPPHYGQMAVEGAQYDEGRDEMEMYWARKARDSNLPSLAICRGAQLMNVAHGGTLHQDLCVVYENTDYPTTPLGHALFRKPISLKPHSRIADIVGRKKMRVNSIHKQAIDTLGDGLTASAVEDNGIIQAIEDDTKDFYLGVQFHPEFLIHRPTFRRIFKRFVTAANRSDYGRTA